MLKIDISQLPVNEAALRAATERYVAAKEAHKDTIGVPAPLPEYEIIASIVEQGGFEVAEDVPQAKPDEGIGAVVDRIIADSAALKKLKSALERKADNEVAIDLHGIR